MGERASKNSIDAYGASGKTNLLTFDPEKLLLVEDESHPLYNPRVKIHTNESLVASIMYRGVIEPVIVWKDPETGKTCVVNGRQRVKAAREANRRLKKQGEKPKLVRATVERGSSQNMMAVMVMADEGRTDQTPLGRAHLAQRLLEAGYTEDALPIILHCSKVALKGYLALLETPADVRRAVEGGLPLKRALEVAELSPEKRKDQLKKLADIQATEKHKARKARAMDAAQGKSSAPKMRSRREIEDLRVKLLAAILPIEGERELRDDWIAALDWVMGKRGVPKGLLASASASASEPETAKAS